MRKYNVSSKDYGINPIEIKSRGNLFLDSDSSGGEGNSENKSGENIGVTLEDMNKFVNSTVTGAMKKYKSEVMENMKREISDIIAPITETLEAMKTGENLPQGESQEGQAPQDPEKAELKNNLDAVSKRLKELEEQREAEKQELLLEKKSKLILQSLPSAILDDAKPLLTTHLSDAVKYDEDKKEFFVEGERTEYGATRIDVKDYLNSYLENKPFLLAPSGKGGSGASGSGVTIDGTKVTAEYIATLDPIKDRDKLTAIERSLPRE